jgi:hypothetical protein
MLSGGNLENYRGISLLFILSKIFSFILDGKLIYR